MLVESKKTNNSDLNFKPVIHKYIELVTKLDIHRINDQFRRRGTEKVLTCN